MKKLAFILLSAAVLLCFGCNTQEVVTTPSPMAALITQTQTIEIMSITRAAGDYLRVELRITNHLDEVCDFNEAQVVCYYDYRLTNAVIDESLPGSFIDLSIGAHETVNAYVYFNVDEGTEFVHVECDTEYDYGNFRFAI